MNVTPIGLAIVRYPIIIEYPNAAHSISQIPILSKYPTMYPSAWVTHGTKMAIETGGDCRTYFFNQ